MPPSGFGFWRAGASPASSSSSCLALPRLRAAVGGGENASLRLRAGAATGVPLGAAACCGAWALAIVICEMSAWLNRRSRICLPLEIEIASVYSGHTANGMKVLPKLYEHIAKWYVRLPILSAIKTNRRDRKWYLKQFQSMKTISSTVRSRAIKSHYSSMPIWAWSWRARKHSRMLLLCSQSRSSRT